MRSVGDLVRRRLTELRLDTKAFIALVASNSGDMSKVLRGQRKLPRNRIDLWVRHLKLSGRAEQEFRTAVHLSWAPPQLRATVERLLDEQTDMRAMVAHYEDVVEIIAKHVEQLRALRGRLRPPADEA